MSVKVFYSSVSGSNSLRNHQLRIFDVLESKKIPFEKMDIAQDPAYKDLMRKIAGNPTALPPQICNGDTYCGDFQAFDEAIENEQLEAFLKL
ncbi:SH3 domain-binding glutamic acid-rich-like protein 3 [Syngnathoides biaculeatus]|uniref:SH3 domain-binding glutamic acid-rich-like protein 3 n=1 Tax=Syngnathoides biaculeatus TaxID=300417 RepID=UPI002ADDFA50|nr:SH3 domain-binding glutamic acid-rich-like protein 3 [Syngnathoides biaculeatus]